MKWVIDEERVRMLRLDGKQEIETNAQEGSAQLT